MRMLVALLVVAGCSGETQYRRVPVEGLPMCPAPEQLYARPIVLEIDHGDGQLTQTFLGPSMGGHPPYVSLPERKSRLRVRVGLCDESGPQRSVACANPFWSGEARELDLDPREPEATLTVEVPGQHACR